jgi:uncharacterized membrane protein
MENLLAAIDWLNIGIESTLLLAPIIIIASAIPLLYNKIPPNNWYGFRTPKTYSDKEIWYKANRFMARDLLVVGVAHLVFTIFFVLFTEINSNTPDNHLTTILWIAGYLVILTVGTLIMFVRSLLYLKKL